MPVELTLAGDGTLAADVKGGKGIHLVCIGDTHDHAKLLIHLRVRCGRLHPPIFEWWPCVSVEAGKNRRRLDSSHREIERRPRARQARRCRDWCAIFGQQRASDTVEGASALDVALDNSDAGRSPRTDRLMEAVDGCLFQTECGLLDVGRGPGRCIVLHGSALVDRVERSARSVHKFQKQPTRKTGVQSIF